MTAPAAVTLEGVGKRFGEGAGAVQAVTDIDLTVAAGEFVSLIGPSGCGAWVSIQRTRSVPVL